MYDCAILVNSCDAYADAWGPFFKILKDTWPECDMPIYLNTETLNCEVPEFRVTTLNCGEINSKKQWGERLISALKRIKETYILFLLEDFFFEEPVKVDIIYKALDWMIHDKNIANINFECSGKYFDDEYKMNHLDEYKYPGFGLKEKNDLFILAANPSIWRKEDLINLTKPFETAWAWEGYGSLRARKYPKEFYCRTLHGERPFVYDNIRGGAIHRGVWVGCTVRPLFEKYGIEIDLNKRGVIEDWLIEQETEEKITLKTKISHAIQRFRSLYC